MDEDLKRKFLQKKLEDLLTDNLPLLPTILCEMDDIRIMELVRPFCCMKGVLFPFRVNGRLKIISEGLDSQKGKRNWGDLYIDVYVN